ncbi:hypothetical protein DSM106972_031050 [Dulcicalothrix desertica PCC 7102]|uniref:Uncharacterized protein n=1 Tax=Dulcicalothrix desertica PCC 7102 TaxID=232991 RepID=A0A433VIJ2_9CYAN|nr:hypothetical protein [Dulcicalothrix desertica]RUT05899.1 hypothetical protein DSM106972_031050 [Dulcicalothrix desertica PCC 7102]TWH54404.1 hypothetical protein CAL7102_02435 [Dulcicalothrix desertica PCC 7102]
MLLRQIIISIICSSLLITQSSITLAQSSDSSGETSGTLQQKNQEEKPSIEAQTARAIRIGFTDGMISFINDRARSKIQLEWEPLPTDKSIIESARKYGYSPVPIKIRNEDLANGKWLTKISATEQNILKQALGVADLKNIRNSDSNFRQLWNLQNPIIQDLLRAKSIEASDYLAVVRDRNILATLLESNGISYSLEVKSDSLGTSSQLPRISDKKINWQINVYKFVVKQQPKVTLYRFAVKAVVEPFEIFFPTQVSEATKVNLEAGISFKQSDKNIGLLDDVRYISFSEETNIALEPRKEDLINKLNQEDASNKLEGILTFAGGSKKLGEVVSQGLLGGSKNISIVSGGVIDFGGGEISPLVGVNSEITNFGDASAGFLFGAGLGDQTSLFIGPSLQASIFTLSAGGLAVQGKKDTEVHLAGLISVDLSRLTGSKKVTNTINLRDKEIGGNWGKASGELLKDLTLLEWTFTSSNSQFRSFSLRKVCDSKRLPVPEEKQTVLTINANDNKIIKFIPKGIYKYEVPPGFQLVTPTLAGSESVLTPAPINPDSDPLEMRESTLESITLQGVEMKKSPNAKINDGENKVNNFCKEQEKPKNSP